MTSNKYIVTCRNKSHIIICKNKCQKNNKSNIGNINEKCTYIRGWAKQDKRQEKKRHNY